MLKTTDSVYFREGGREGGRGGEGRGTHQRGSTGGSEVCVQDLSQVVGEHVEVIQRAHVKGRHTALLVERTNVPHNAHIHPFPVRV